jgi:CheY-like chemotaxis protein
VLLLFFINIKEVRVIDMTSMLDLKQSSPEKSSHEFILVVEDDAAISELLAICIEEETSYHTLSVTSGEETLRRIEELKETRPLLFILDLLLPTMNGVQLYDRLHSIKEFEHVPAIFLTAATPDKQMQSTIAERGLEILPKPFDLADLLRCIDQALQRRT